MMNTSYHGDHSYGDLLFPLSTQIVQHVETQAYIQRHFTDDVAFMKQYFGANQGLDELKPRAADVLLNDNANVEIERGGSVGDDRSDVIGAPQPCSIFDLASTSGLESRPNVVTVADTRPRRVHWRDPGARARVLLNDLRRGSTDETRNV